MRLLYSLLMYLLSPFMLAYFTVRGFRDRRYWQRWPERLALGNSVPGTQGPVWIHAASLGEVNAASPLIDALMLRFPEQALIVTTFTPTGSERVKELFGERLAHQYIPLDFPGAVKRFLNRVQPQLGIIMETELWPNLFCLAHAQKRPMIISNARLSDSSMRGYRIASSLIKETLLAVNRLLAQSDKDADRYSALGMPPDRVRVVGNLKFDVSIQASVSETGELLRSGWGVQRTVLVAGSTHAEDEIELFAAFSQALKHHPLALLVLAPRHPERFATVAEEARDFGFTVRSRSQSTVPDQKTQVFVLDSMGELLDFYAAADVTFIGGTMANVGGHNLLEPAALGKALLMGPHTENVQEIAKQLVDQGAARQVHDRHDLAEAVNVLFGQAITRDQMGMAGKRLVSSGRGALEQTLEELRPYLKAQARTRNNAAP